MGFETKKWAFETPKWRNMKISRPKKGPNLSLRRQKKGCQFGRGWESKKRREVYERYTKKGLGGDFEAGGGEFNPSLRGELH